MTSPRSQAEFAAAVLALALLSTALCAAAPPEQPVRYSQKIHVTGYKLDCRFCRSSTNKSQYANIPSVEKCMMCHRSIATDKPEVKKVAQNWNEKKPIP